MKLLLQISRNAEEIISQYYIHNDTCMYRSGLKYSNKLMFFHYQMLIALYNITFNIYYKEKSKKNHQCSKSISQKLSFF